YQTTTNQSADNVTHTTKCLAFAKYRSPCDNDLQEFRIRGCQMINYVADYLTTVSQRPVFSMVKPGYLASLIPDHPPQNPDSWDEIFADIERVIMPGVTHWHHPHFHAYFPCANSYPAICADILSDGIGCIGFTWASSPACTELEVIMLDWIAQSVDLPKQFMSGSGGGGVIQVTLAYIVTKY
ncbi:unnamed protein product, partial [Protopolystoma xenopodis]